MGRAGLEQTALCGVVTDDPAHGAKVARKPKSARRVCVAVAFFSSLPMPGLTGPAHMPLLGPGKTRQNLPTRANA